MTKYRNLGFLYALVSALFFGTSTPAAKYLLGSISPWLLAGILYLGSGIGLFAIFIIRKFFSKLSSKEEPLRGKDWLWFALTTFFGGILGPILLMLGLVKTDAASASLLLNLEMVFTTICAGVIFKEHIGKRIIFGMVVIVLGSSLLSWQGHFSLQVLIGPLLIAGACLSWALDNNFARNISAADPIQIVMLKSLLSGVTNTVLAFIVGANFHSVPHLFSAGIIGFLGYGLSLCLYMLALRHIGTSRTSAYFAVSPFVGAILAVLFLKEAITWQLITASLLMLLGIWLHLTEEHEHEHEHEAMYHAHKHVHDEHHQHEHEPNDPPGEPHTHWHKHEPMVHCHPHYPDIHHRH